MIALRRGWSRLLGALRGRRDDGVMTEELRAHIEMLVADKVRRGMPAAEARRVARLEFGDVDAIADSCRDQRGLPRIESVLQDARYGLRGLRRSPSFTATALGCLALGIGSATSIFTLVNASVLRPLPVSHPEQLAVFSWTSNGRQTALPQSSSGMRELSMPYAALRAFSTRARTLSGALAFVRLGFDASSVSVGIGTRATVASGEMVSGGYFSVLGVSTFLGRPLGMTDAAPGTPNAVVLSDAFWHREFAGDRSAVGRAITLNGQPFTVVGVAPSEFRGLDPGFAPDLWVPLRETPGLRPWGLPASTEGPSLFDDASYFWCTMAGRLRPGVTREQATSDLGPIFQQTITEGLSPVPPAGDLPRLVVQDGGRGLDDLRTRLATPLRVLSAGGLLLLLIACTNVATLLLARSESRQREIGVRLAIGASRARVVQQLLVEGILLGAGGGALGLLAAYWGGPVLLLWLCRSEAAVAIEPRVDLTVLAFSAGLAMLTGVAFGLAPAFRATGLDVASRLRKESRTVSSRRVLGRALVAGQVALSVLLLFGAGLFVRTLANLAGQGLGFDAGHLLLFQLDPERAGYDRDRSMVLYQRALDRITQLPGVQSATVSGNALLSGWSSSSPTSTDAPAGTSRSTKGTYWNAVGPGFLETLRIPIVLGRGIGRQEAWGGPRVAIVNRAWARAAFPAETPIGHRVALGSRFNAARSFEIVGVVEDAKYDRLRREAPPTVYLPYGTSGRSSSRLWFEVRTEGDPRAVAGSVREAVRGIDATLPLMNLRTQREQLYLSLSQERMFASVSSAFGALALLLVGTGLFGTLAYAVSRRTSEIGIRMALGADARRISTMVLREALALVAIGVAVGLPAALGLTRLARSLLFGVTPYDGLTMTVTLAVLAGAGIAAGLGPARRAARIQPMQALRSE